MSDDGSWYVKRMIRKWKKQLEYAKDSGDKDRIRNSKKKLKKYQRLLNRMERRGRTSKLEDTV